VLAVLQNFGRRLSLLYRPSSTVLVDNFLIISNSRSWLRTDLVMKSAHNLAVACIQNRQRPKFVFHVEGSTHFDDRTNPHEVAVQFTLLAK